MPDLDHLSIDVTRPWLGLLPFTEATRQYFFGRDTEIQEIHDRIRENILTVLFGQSGLGKTSLLGAGVLPRLREDGMAPVLLRLVHADTGSFPSGHTANAATMVVVLGILFPRVWVWCLGVAWAVLMAISRTYLGAHWISDTIGGLLLGAGVAVIVWTPLAHRLALEATRPHPFFLARSRQ